MECVREREFATTFAFIRQAVTRGLLYREPSPVSTLRQEGGTSAPPFAAGTRPAKLEEHITLAITFCISVFD